MLFKLKYRGEKTKRSKLRYWTCSDIKSGLSKLWKALTLQGEEQPSAQSGNEDEKSSVNKANTADSDCNFILMINERALLPSVASNRNKLLNHTPQLCPNSLHTV